MISAMLKRWLRPKHIYLDYAAATPLRPSVREVMEPYQSVVYANPSAIHRAGTSARAAIDQSRQQIARILEVRPEGVVFTGNGTESNNLAIYGLVRRLVESGRSFTDMEIITTATEHPSVLEVVNHLADYGLKVRYCPVNEEGLIKSSELSALLTEKTVLVSFAYANSETGVVQPVRQLVKAVKDFSRQHHTKIRVHLDAAQAPLWLPCQLNRLGVDLMTLDAGKCYGPKGVGVLIKRHGVDLKPVLLGGGQEFGLRAGTENTAGIVGAAKAIVTAQEGHQERSESVAKLRDEFIKELETIDGLVLNGHCTKRLANNVNVSIPGLDTEFAVVALDREGIVASTKSACSGASGSGSATVLAMTQNRDRANSTIRFSLGEETTHSDLKKTVQSLHKHIIKMKEYSKYRD